jgi:hypothetical protein
MLLFLACKNQIIKQQIYGILWGINLFAIPGFFYFLLDDLNTKNSTDSYAWFYLAGMFVGMLVSSAFYQLGNMEDYHTMLQFKTIISNEIFKMCLKRRLPCAKSNTKKSNDNTGNSINKTSKANEWNNGAVTNLLNTDIATLEEAIIRLHLYLGSVVQVIIAFSLLWYIIGAASLFGLVALILCTTVLSMRLIKGVRNIHMRRIATDKRLSTITEVII